VSFFCILSAITLLNVSNHAYNVWFASVDEDNGQPVLSASDWTNNRHYVCQYDCEWRFMSHCLIKITNYHGSRWCTWRKLYVGGKPQIQSS